MFNQSRKFTPPAKSSKSNVAGTSKASGNAFVNEIVKKSNTTFSEEGAVKYASTLNPFLDDFGMASKYKTTLRTYDEVSKTMHELYNTNPELCVAMSLYMRIVPRNTRLVNSHGIVTEKQQIGAGLKHESLLRWMWLAINHKDVFEQNFALYLSGGSWKDLFNMLRFDLTYNTWDKRVLDWNFFLVMIQLGMSDPYEVEHIRQYIPLQKSASKIKNLAEEVNNTISKWLSVELFGAKGGKSKSYRELREFKKKGKIHAWQGLISQGKHDELSFKAIPGRARNLLVKSKYLKNQNLSEKYTNWLNTKGKATQNYTGFVHELFKGCVEGRNLKFTDMNYQRTVEEQFLGLVEKAAQNVDPEFSGWLAVVDISNSMDGMSAEKLSARTIAHIHSLFLHYLFQNNAFSKVYFTFEGVAAAHKWVGNTVTSKLENALEKPPIIGSTHLAVVSDLMGALLKKVKSENEFPRGIVIYSDGEFARTSRSGSTETEDFRKALVKHGFSKEYAYSLKLVLWDIPNSFYGTPKPKFEVLASSKNSYHMSGFSAEGLSLLSSGKFMQKPQSTAEDLMMDALNQELMSYITI